MKKGSLVLIAFGLLFLFYIALKWAGILGGFVSAGLNSQNDIVFDYIGEEIVVEVKSTVRPATRYRIRPLDRQKIEELGQVYQLTSHESYCDGTRFGTPTTMKSTTKTIYERYHPRSTYGKIVHAPFLHRLRPVCVHLTLDSLSPEDTEPPKFKVSISNLRPCWFIECILD